MPSLRIVVAGQSFEAPLPDSAVRIGTAPVCDLTLACEGVATEHAVLEPLPGGTWRLKDLGTGRGTRVNGQEVRQITLKPGDVVEVGAARITFDPQAAPSPPPLPAARPAAAPAPVAKSVAAAPVAPAPQPRAVEAAHGSGTKKLLLALLVIAGVGGALVAFGLTGGGSGGDDARARRDLETAIARYKQRDVLGARKLLLDLTQRVRTGEVAREASTWLASATTAVGQAESELAGWVTDALNFDLGAATSRRAVFLERHGQGFAAQVDAALERVGSEQQAWQRAELRRVEEDVLPLLEEGRWRDARARWNKSRTSAPAGVDLGQSVGAALARVDEAAQAAASALLERVATAARARGPAAGVQMLSPVLAHYEGTVAHGRLSERLLALEAEAKVAAPTPVVAPAPEAPTAPTAPTTPAAPTPAAPDAVLAFEAQAAKAAGERAFANAVDLLDQALKAAGDGPHKARLTDLRADVALARTGLDTLAGAITADPKRFGRFELSEKLFVSPVSADREGVAMAVQGGSTRLRWATMRLDMLTQLVERMPMSAQDALPLAALLYKVGAEAAYERMLVKAGEGSADPAHLFAMLARWRGEPLPAAGYVVYEERYVTAETRERLILEARIRGGLDRLASARDAAARRAAIDELRALGEAATTPLVTALRARRDGLVDALMADKSLTSAKVRQRLYDLLEKRRAHALALIEDEGAYPYPNPNKLGQAEVEKRVDEVREVWERPFRLVAGMDDGVKAQLDLVIEVDEALAGLVPGYKPDLQRLEAGASKVIDMPGFAPAGQAGSTREYSLKVIAFNERVATSARREERDNVRAVNEYRMMMGRAAVKIEERLVRAARGHSRHMNQNGYFAHDAPPQFPQLANPGLRARRQGYGGGVGENIAWGTPSGRDAFSAWFGSSGHHRNMLGRGWTEMGAGRSAPHHWTQLFGAAGGRGLGDPEPLAPPAEDVAPDPESSAPLVPPPGLTPRVPDERPPGKAPDTPDPDAGS